MPSLNWIGKDAVLNHHRDVPYRLLQCEGGLSNGDPGSGNLLIEGDNLEALKALLPYYKGKVKCIYIDPPYNTGEEDWRYNDNVNSPEIRAWLGKTVGVELLDRHDRWLCMMWPRLSLLKELLSDDGSFFMSIDENEFSRSRLILDSIFGERNHIADMIWEKSRKNDAHFISVGHEYVIVYARNKTLLEERGVRWREYKPGTREIQRRFARARMIFGDDFARIEQALTRFYKSRPPEHPSKNLSRYKRVDAKGVWRDDNNAWPKPGGPTYPIVHPLTGLPCPIPPNGWRWSTYEKFLEALDNGTAEFRADHTEAPQRKTYLIKEGSAQTEDEEEIGVQVRGTYFYRSLQPAAKELRRLFGEPVFNNPKDHNEIARLISLTTQPGDLVLDSFAGSGTTGHAVHELHQTTGERRRFILVEMLPNVARPVTARRLELVGIPFRFCILGETLFTAEGMISGEVTRERLAHHVWFTETGEPLPHAVPESPLIGEHNGRAIALIEGPLTVRSLRDLPPSPNGMIVYADACRVDAERLASLGIVFKAIPYDVRDA